jgi:ankyrin repeat protein
MPRTIVPTPTVRALPERANLQYLKKLAKDELKTLRADQPDSKLADAQLAVARRHGFASWRALHAHVTAPPAAARAVDDAEVADFLRLVRRGEEDAVRRRLDESPQLVNQTGKHPSWGGRPQALHVAIERGDQAMFDLLLERGADPAGDNTAYDGWSPLMLAVHWKRDAMRDRLVRLLPQVSLIEALMLGDDARALRLLESGDLGAHAPFPNDATPLHFATTPTAAERLLELGVKLEATDKYGRTALDLASKRQLPELVALLTSRGAPGGAIVHARLGDLPALRRFIGRRKETDPRLVVEAVAQGHANVVKWLLRRGADVNTRDEAGSRATLLHSAAWRGDLKMARLLVSAGADVNAVDEEHKTTPLVWAETARQYTGNAACDAVAEFLRHADGWSVEKLPAHRRSHKIVQWKPIMDAAYNGDAKRVRELIAAGADPNVLSSTPHRHRPLHRAIERRATFPRDERHEAVVKVLLEAGADPKLRGTHGKHTALQLAAIDSPRFVPMLVDRFKPLDLFHAVVLCDAKRVAAVLQKDPSAAKRADENDWSPLHYCAASAMGLGDSRRLKAQLRIAEMLLEAGADVNATYTYGGEWPIPVLFYACGYHDNPAMTELLMRRGANPYDQESVYHASDEGHDACLAVIERLADRKKLAAECSRCLASQLHWKHTRGLPWLLAHGANPNELHPRHGDNALHAAVKAGCGEKVIRLLLDAGADPRVKNAEGKTAAQLAKKAAIKSLLAGSGRS